MLIRTPELLQPYSFLTYDTNIRKRFDVFLWGKSSKKIWNNK